MKKTIKTILSVLLFLLLLFTAFYIYRQKTLVENEKSQELYESSYPVVNVSKAKMKMVKQEDSAFGTIVYYQKAVVPAEVEGIVEGVYTKVGDIVRKGDKLVSLNDEEYQGLYRAEELKTQIAKHSYELSKENIQERMNEVKKKLLIISQYHVQIEGMVNSLEKMKKEQEEVLQIVAVNGVSKKALTDLQFEISQTELNLDSMELEYQSALLGYSYVDLEENGYLVSSQNSENEIQSKLLNMYNKRFLEQAKTYYYEYLLQRNEFSRIREQISKTVLRAPINGQVVAVDYNYGEKVNAKDPVVTIFNADYVYVDVNIPHERIEFFPIGTELDVNINQKKYKGRVDVVSPVLDSQTRNANLKILVENKSQKIKIGSIGKISHESLNGESKITIPIEALVELGTKKLVYIVVNDRVFVKQIEISSIIDNDVIIVAGLNEGDMVVTSAHDSLEDGEKVQVYDEQ